MLLKEFKNIMNIIIEKNFNNVDYGFYKHNDLISKKDIRLLFELVDKLNIKFRITDNINNTFNLYVEFKSIFSEDVLKKKYSFMGIDKNTSINYFQYSLLNSLFSFDRFVLTTKTNGMILNKELPFRYAKKLIDKNET